MRETQQRALMDSIPKDLNRPWEDPLPEPGERHIAQELRGLGYTQEAVPEWKTKSMGKGYAECGSNHRLADQPTLLLTRLSPIVEQAALRLAGQEYELLADASALTIVTKDLRGHSALKLPLGGRGVVAHDGDGGAAVRRAAYVHRDAVVVTETLVGESQPLSTCRRTLQRDGRMRIEISKRTPEGKTVAMAAIASRSRPAPSIRVQC